MDQLVPVANELWPALSSVEMKVYVVAHCTPTFNNKIIKLRADLGFKNKAAVLCVFLAYIQH
jgi:hypothetical protein